MGFLPRRSQKHFHSGSLIPNCCRGQWHLYRSPNKCCLHQGSLPGHNISCTSNFSRNPERVPHAHNSCVWSVLAPTLSCNFSATVKWLWMTPEVPWLASWLLFGRRVPDIFEIVERYGDEIHKGKIQPKGTTLSFFSFCGLSYETQANITDRVDCV